MKTAIYLLISVLSLISLSNETKAYEKLVANISDDVEITFNQFPAEGEYLMLWPAPEFGFRTAHQQLAEHVSKLGVEVWQSNIVESLFLPQGSSSIKQLDAEIVADLIEFAHKTTSKKIILAGNSYASITALRGAHQWQKRQHETPYLIGAILFSPYTFAQIPTLGTQPQYLPIVDATNIPLMIYQTQKSAIMSQFSTLVQKLRQHHNPVYTRLLPDIMSLFYQEPPGPEMIENSRLLAPNIRQMIRLLEQHPLPAQPIKLQTSITTSTSGIDTYLRPFLGKVAPKAIELSDVTGKQIQLKDFRNRVTVINFWASWCPPCIEEIPSLNRLNLKMTGQPFNLISINYGEDRDTVLEFMQSVSVDFPVLLDHTGQVAKQWNVISYPSTFIIDAEANIKYGVNAAIEWDNPDIIKILESLIEKTID